MGHFSATILHAHARAERIIAVRAVESLPRAAGHSANAPLSVFLDPELVHVGERVGPVGLEGVPTIEVARETVAAEHIAIMLHDGRREFETDEFQVVLGEEEFDLRYGQPALLDVEQEIAALA